MNERILKTEHASGKRFVLGIGVVFVVMAIGLWLGLSGYLHHIKSVKPPETALRWEDRDLWPRTALRPFELEYDTMVQAETGKRYRKAEFALAADPAQEQRIETALLACAALARDRERFAAQETGAQLEALRQAIPDQFYPPYLLAAWHEANDRPAEAQLWMAKAVALAPCLLMEDGHAPGHPIAPLAIAFDRLKTVAKTDASALEHAAHHTKTQIINRNLILVYPAPAADDKGRIWLPVFRDMYRWAPPAKADPMPDDHWFSMPGSNRVGHLNAAGSKVPARP